MIYVVEDDSGIRELVVYTLKNTGFAAAGCGSADEYRKAAAKEKPELVLLDIMLPGEDGLSLLADIRRSHNGVSLPVIMMTAKDTEFDKVKGLDAGADDYIAKPFGMMEMVSRVRAVLRRTGKTEEPQALSCGCVTLDERTHRVCVDGNEVTLTLKEYELLRELMKSRGRVLTRDMLLSSVWGYEYGGETRTADVHIRTLRAKLGKGGDIIETVRGVGYRTGGDKQ